MYNIMSVFRKVQKAYQNYCFEAVAQDNIKMSEMSCLLFLYNHAPLDTAHDIAEHQQLSPSMICKSVDALKEAGYLQARRDHLDSRCVHLTLTDKAQPLIQKLAVRQKEFIEKLTFGIPEQDFSCLQSIFEKMHRNFTNMNL